MLLLVSVTNLQEAKEAYRGGADILDLKNPSEGSLGAPHSSTVKEIYDHFADTIPISTALGDFPHLPGTASLAAFGAACSGTDYIKLGLYGSNTPEKAELMLNAVGRALNGNHSFNAGPGVKRTKLIAAAYADYKTSGTLDPLLLPSVARKAGFDGCMIDTYNKKEKNLFDYLGQEQLGKFISLCEGFGLLSALAGSLGIGDLPLLETLNPDIIGVRGAVCVKNNRQAGLDSTLVVKLKKALKSR